MIVNMCMHFLFSAAILDDLLNIWNNPQNMCEHSFLMTIQLFTYLYRIFIEFSFGIQINDSLAYFRELLTDYGMHIVYVPVKLC